MKREQTYSLIAIFTIPLIVLASAEAFAQNKAPKTRSRAALNGKMARGSANNGTSLRKPAGLEAKPVLIPRRALPPERQFQFDPAGIQIPGMPAKFNRPTPRAALPEIKIETRGLQPEPARSIENRSAKINAKASALPTLSPDAQFKFKAPEENLKKVETYSAEELQLFEAYVHLEDLKKPVPALGSFATLMVKKSNLQESARWGYAHAALQLDLRVQYELTLIDFMKSGSEAWNKRAFESLVLNSDAEKSVWVQHLTEAQFENPPTDKTSDAYLMLRAHRFVAVKRVKDALDSLRKISADSVLYGKRTYHEALLMYRQGQPKEAKELLETALKTKPAAFSENELKAKSYMLMGRLAFQSRDFKKAFEAYRTVPQNNPAWPEAMQEQALSQILFEDYVGAAGNMFSLHTDFFKKSYSPDSYLIRTVGYLNLCQYADSLKAVQELQRKYKPILAGLEHYSKSTSAEKDYDTIREFAKNPAVNDVKGVARPFLFVWTQDPDFERHQTRINQFEDEMEAFRNLSLQVVKMEREMTKKISDIGTDLSKAMARKDSVEKIDKLKSLDQRAKAEFKLLQLARKSLATLRPEMTAKLELQKNERKALALQALTTKRKELHAHLKDTIDQSEVLLYEIYNGAGDHLRFQAAGGEIGSKKTATLATEKEKSLNWKFQGEIWEDELGHYRSSLTNVCPSITAGN